MDEAYPRGSLRGLLAQITNIKLGWKWLSVKNAQAYSTLFALVIAITSFIVKVPRVLKFHKGILMKGGG